MASCDDYAHDWTLITSDNPSSKVHIDADAAFVEMTVENGVGGMAHVCLDGPEVEELIQALSDAREATRATREKIGERP